MEQRQKPLREELYGKRVSLRERLAIVRNDPAVKVTKEATKPIKPK